MIIYIHGFGSSGEGMKAKLFREYFKSQNIAFIAPSLSYIPDLAIQTLDELINTYEDVMLIGSSLGGFYSLYLAQKYNLKAVLINPSTKPFVTLHKCVGYAPSFHDTSNFLWMDEHIESLKKYSVDFTNQENLMLLVQKGDETINYEEAVIKLPNATQVVEDGGNHSFEDIEKHFEKIKVFFTK